MEPVIPLTAWLHWAYVRETYPALARVLGSEDALRDLVAVLTLVHDRAVTEARHIAGR